MKKTILFVGILLAAFSLFLNSCRNEEVQNGTPEQNGIVNQQYAFSKGELEFITTDLSNDGHQNIVNREIKVFSNKKNREILNLKISIVADKDANFYNKTLKKDVNYIMTVSNNGNDVYRAVVKNGKYYSSQILYNVNAKSAKEPCTFKGNLKCVDDKLKEMNWFDYGICCATAPACYAQTWGSCIVDNCSDEK